MILDLYVVRILLGEGGMGRVYRVHHPGWDLDLALKVPSNRGLATAGGREKFVREAETWVTLPLHPNVVQAFYVRELENGLPGIFVEYCDAGSLNEGIRANRMDRLAWILDIAIQIAWGTAHAHAQGLVHCDLKPSNVLMTRTGIAKVTDFGLARRHHQPDRDEESGDWRGVVEVTTAAGTPGYMAPEQGDVGRPIDDRADVFAFGVTLWRMMGGSLPWIDKSPAIARRAVSALLARPEHSDCPDRLMDLVLECLEPDPQKRSLDMSALAEELCSVYRDVMNRPYPRAIPRVGDALADGRNNRAASLLDLRRQEDAVESWESALECDPQHLESRYNLGLLEWRGGRITDDELLRRLAALDVTGEGAWQVHLLMAQIHGERGDRSSARVELERARRAGASSDVVQRFRREFEVVDHFSPMADVMKGHAGWVTSVDLSRDGNLVVSASEDGTVRIWHPADGRCQRVLEGHRGWVWSACFRGDESRYVFSAGGDGTVRLWEWETGRCVRTFAGHAGSVRSISTDQDGAVLMSGGDDRSVRLWDVTTGRCIATIRGHQAAVTSVMLGGDSRLAISGGRDGTVRVWDVQSRVCLQSWPDHGDTVSSVCLSRRLAFSAGRDRIVRCWDVSSGSCVRVFAGHTAAVMSVSVDPQGSTLVTGGGDNSVRIWEVATGRCLRTLHAHSGTVRSVRWDPATGVLVSGSEDKTVRSWYRKDTSNRRSAQVQLSRIAATQHVLEARSTHERALSELHSLLDGGDAPGAAQAIRKARSVPGYERIPEVLEAWARLYVCLPRAGFRAAWRAWTDDGHTSAITSVRLSRDGRRAVSGSEDGTVRLWDVRDGKCRCRLSGHDGWVTSVCLNAGGTVGVSGGADGRVVRWDMHGGNGVRFPGHAGAVTSVDLVPDGDVALSGGKDEMLRLWDTVDCRCLYEVRGHPNWLTSVRVGADARRAVSGGRDRSLRVWDLQRRRCLRILRGHAGSLNSVSLCADGQTALSGGDDGVIRVWDLAAGTCRRAIAADQGAVHTVCSIRDGRFAVSGGQNATVRIWDVVTGHCLHSLDGHAGPVRSVDVSCDARHLLSGSEDGRLVLWFLDWELAEPPPVHWDDGAAIHLEMFLMRIAATEFRRANVRELRNSERMPAREWTDTELDWLMFQLGCAGYGWLDRERVRRQLDELAARWEVPQHLFPRAGWIASLRRVWTKPNG